MAIPATPSATSSPIQDELTDAVARALAAACGCFEADAHGHDAAVAVTVVRGRRSNQIS